MEIPEESHVEFKDKMVEGEQMEIEESSKDHQVNYLVSFLSWFLHCREHHCLDCHIYISMQFYCMLSANSYDKCTL